MKETENSQLLPILAKREKWVAANRENGFEDGILRLLSQLYPDQAHFLYELLQNAEDARARTVTFVLTHEQLQCRHDGTRLFTADNVDCITSIGKSTKVGDINQIGEFGVGFKAVFSYTNSPRVHSGNYSFEIRDLVCPHPIASPPGLDNQTVFEFPFNRREKTKETCFDEIAKTLESLSENTLMFLDSIKEIKWQTDGGGEGSVRSAEHEDGVLEIEHRGIGCPVRSTYWLRFQKSYEEKRGLRVAAAFSLAFRDDKTTSYNAAKPVREQFRICPVEECCLCIFFPAAKEKTKLKFHVHGPYASTVDRASILLDHQVNMTLVKETGSLLVSALGRIKSLGLLDRDFLEVLPNTDDRLDPFYAPLMEAITTAMRENALVPTDSGGHDIPANLRQGPRAVRDLLSVERLAFLFDDSSIHWAVGCMQNSRSERFLRTLSITELGSKELISLLCQRFSGHVPARNSAWLKEQSDDWLSSLYGVLDGVLNRAIESKDYAQYERIQGQLAQCRLVRLTDDTHVVGCGVFFPDEKRRQETGDLPTVKTELIASAKEKENQRNRSFLQAIGVKTLDEEQEIRLILAKWYVAEARHPTTEMHLRHIRHFITFLAKKTQLERTTAVKLFNNHFIFLDRAEKSFRKPSDYLLDEPFRTTGLDTLKERKIPGYADVERLWNGYLPLEEEGFSSFAESVGVATGLVVRQIDTWKNPASDHLHTNCTNRSRHEIDEDFSIEHLSEMIETEDVRISLLIWRAMCSIAREKLIARYSPNRRHEVREAPSVLVHELRKHAWIPDRNGEFHKSADMMQCDLPEGFAYNDSNGWLTAIRFGEDARQLSAGNMRRPEIAKEIGLQPGLVEKILAFPAAEQEEVQNQIQKFLEKMAATRRRPQTARAEPVAYHEVLEEAFARPANCEAHESAPAGGASADPKRRRERIGADIAAAIDAEPSPESRVYFGVCRKWKGKDDSVRVALLAWYAGKCQICGETFTQRNGTPYFEGVYLVPYTRAEWPDRVGNVVCVCARHSAMLQFGPLEEDAPILDQILALKTAAEGGTPEQSRLRLTLCGEQVYMRYEEKHFIDLQEMIKTSQRAGDDKL